VLLLLLLLQVVMEQFSLRIWAMTLQVMEQFSLRMRAPPPMVALTNPEASSCTFSKYQVLHIIETTKWIVIVVGFKSVQ
jgi:hypothetical protein